MPRLFLHHFQHQNSKFRHLIFFLYLVCESSPHLTLTLHAKVKICKHSVGELMARSEKCITEFCPPITHSQKPSSVKVMQLGTVCCMNLEPRICVEQGDYKIYKEKQYKLLTFLSNGILLYLQETTKMIHLKRLMHFIKLICRNVQPVVKSLEQLRSIPLARSFQDMCEWLYCFLK